MNDAPQAPRQSRRVAKASQAIKEVVSTTILFELRDPRIKNVTVLRAEAAADLRTAKVYLSVRGDAKTEALSLKGLESARGFLQARIADRLQTRHTPILSFRIDRGYQQSLETLRVLREEQNSQQDQLQQAEGVAPEPTHDPARPVAASPAEQRPPQSNADE